MVLLVGGFASNMWLFDQLRYSIEPLGLALYRPITYTHVSTAHCRILYVSFLTYRQGGSGWSHFILPQRYDTTPHCALFLRYQDLTLFRPMGS